MRARGVGLTSVSDLEAPVRGGFLSTDNESAKRPLSVGAQKSRRAELIRYGFELAAWMSVLVALTNW